MRLPRPFAPACRRRANTGTQPSVEEPLRLPQQQRPVAAFLAARGGAADLAVALAAGAVVAAVCLYAGRREEPTKVRRGAAAGPREAAALRRAAVAQRVGLGHGQVAHVAGRVDHCAADAPRVHRAGEGVVP